MTLLSAPPTSAGLTPVDVVVLGGGMAGVCAALAAHDAGASVVVVEKAPALGGTARLSGGVVWTEATEEGMRRRNPLGDPQLSALLPRRYADTIAWLEGHGVEFGPELRDYFGSGVARRIEPNMPGFFAFAGSRLRELGVELRTGSQAVGLSATADGWVVSVRDDSGTGIRLVARAVVLASGGFAADPELLTRYVGPNADRMFVRAHLGNTGDGLRLATAHGAALSRSLSTFYGHLMPAAPTRIDRTRLVDFSQYYSDECVLVNVRGERFTDESLGDEFNAQALVREKEALGFLILDAAIEERINRPRASGFPPPDRLALIEESGGLVLRADTIEGLAPLITAAGGFGRGTVDTVAHYNAHVESFPERMPVPRARHRHRLDRGPFVAVPVIPAVTATHGGLSVDERGRVLHRGGFALNGLYAAGSDVGGVYHEAYGGGLALAAVFGRISGSGAAEFTRGNSVVE